MDSRDEKIMQLLEMYEDYLLKSLSGMAEGMCDGDKDEVYKLITTVNTLDWKTELLPVLRRYVTEDLCDMLINMMGSEVYQQFISNLMPMFEELEPVLHRLADKFKNALINKEAA